LAGATVAGFVNRRDIAFCGAKLGLLMETIVADFALAGLSDSCW
jgi:hypothetical protein